LDFYRFVSAVGIALAHYTLYFPVSPAFRHYIFERGEPLMAFFFTLSGFVIMHVYDVRITSLAKYGDYLKRRLARIYPIFLATFAISLIYGIYTNNQSGMFASSAILPNLLLIHAWNTTHMLTFDYPSWSVSAEFFVYLLFPVFLFMVNRLGLFAFALPFVLGLAVIAAFSVFGLENWMGATFNGGCLRAAPSFVAGMVVSRLATREFTSFRAPAWLAHSMAAATIALVLAGAPGVVVLVYMAAFIFVLVAAEPERPGSLSSPFARNLANASYGFYLLHVPVADILLRSLVHRLGWPISATYALAPVAIVVTTALAIASFQYFEAPTRRYLIHRVWRIPALPGFSNKNKRPVRDVF
jgi:peptidoglycan/LPS O-acetylase OafA/YrhL